ncbi:MAG: peptidoglycan-binding protein [Pseudomonadota bacterium]
MALFSAHFSFNDRLLGAQKNAPPIRRGDFGFAVRLIQNALSDLGYRHKLTVTYAKFGSPDGRYGNETKEAVRQFQKDVKLASKDGIVGENTITAMDKLLRDKKIPFMGLPALPPGSPGDVKDVDANARLVLLGALSGSNPLRHLNWKFKWHQLSTDVVHEATIFGREYDKIGQAVSDDAITVEVHPTIAAAAFYVPKAGMDGVPTSVSANTFVVSRPLRFNLNDRSLVIHEATHAICDLRGKTMNALFSEMLGFIAESIFAVKAMGSPKSAHKVYKLGYEIAEHVLNRDEPPTTLVDDFIVNLRADPTYGKYTHGTTMFDGIPL